MLKHRGFPGRLPGTDYQFSIRRANPRGVTPIIRRERHRDRKPADRRAVAVGVEPCRYDLSDRARIVVRAE